MNKEKFEQKFVSACQESGLTEMLKAANNQSLSQAVRRTLNILHAKLGNECTIVGRVQSIGEKTNVSKKEKEFFKRELILNASRYDSMTGEELTNIVKLTFAQKHCDKLDGFNSVQHRSFCHTWLTARAAVTRPTASCRRTTSSATIRCPCCSAERQLRWGTAVPTSEHR